MVKLTIDGMELQVKDGTTILDAALQAGIHIPTLCYLKNLNKIGACRVCMVEVEGNSKLVTACNTRAVEGMVVHTNSPKVRKNPENQRGADSVPARHELRHLRKKRQLQPPEARQ